MSSKRSLIFILCFIPLMLRPESFLDKLKGIGTSIENFPPFTGKFWKGLGTAFGASPTGYVYSFAVYNDSPLPVYIGIQRLVSIMGATFPKADGWTLIPVKLFENYSTPAPVDYYFELFIKSSPIEYTNHMPYQMHSDVLYLQDCIQLQTKNSTTINYFRAYVGKDLQNGAYVHKLKAEYVGGYTPQAAGSKSNPGVTVGLAISSLTFRNSTAQDYYIGYVKQAKATNMTPATCQFFGLVAKDSFAIYSNTHIENKLSEIQAVADKAEAKALKAQTVAAKAATEATVAIQAEQNDSETQTAKVTYEQAKTAYETAVKTAGEISPAAQAAKQAYEAAITQTGPDSEITKAAKKTYESAVHKAGVKSPTVKTLEQTYKTAQEAYKKAQAAAIKKALANHPHAQAAYKAYQAAKTAEEAANKASAKADEVSNDLMTKHSLIPGTIGLFDATTQQLLKTYNLPSQVFNGKTYVLEIYQDASGPFDQLSMDLQGIMPGNYDVPMGRVCDITPITCVLWFQSIAQASSQQKNLQPSSYLDLSGKVWIVSLGTDKTIIGNAAVGSAVQWTITRPEVEKKLWLYFIYVDETDDNKAQAFVQSFMDGTIGSEIITQYHQQAAAQMQYVTSHADVQAITQLKSNTTSQASQALLEKAITGALTLNRGQFENSEGTVGYLLGADVFLPQGVGSTSNYYQLTPSLANAQNKPNTAVSNTSSDTAPTGMPTPTLATAIAASTVAPAPSESEATTVTSTLNAAKGT
ncbi:MAG TPA: hypothetical protein VLG50_04050 [Candidatus Saccharimonadales bacterium]|nr:hypothetical protein [Candidatus Saccharimonadales bacterium]